MYPFDPDRLGELETAGWRAYYDRRWLALARILVVLNQEQFHIPFPLSLLAAYHVVRASVAWVPLDHDARAVQRHLAAFYRLARRFAGRHFDVERTAALELDYFDVHRRLAGLPDKREFVETLVALHSALFGLPPERARESAERRVAAATAVDLITSGRSTNVAADWARVEAELRRCYRSIYRELRRVEAPVRPVSTAPASAHNDYHFVTRWRLRGTCAEVADVLSDAEGLVHWWPSVYLAVRELEPGDERGVGKVVALHTRGRLPYTLRWQFRVTEVDHPRGFALDAWGDFVGTGRWTFVQDGPWVEIEYDWRIRADKPLLRYLSFLLKPVFSANHRWAMDRGAESLARELARRRTGHARSVA